MMKQRGPPSGDAVSAAALTGPLQAALPGRTVATQRARATTRRPLGHASPRWARAATGPQQWRTLARPAALRKTC